MKLRSMLLSPMRLGIKLAKTVGKWMNIPSTHKVYNNNAVSVINRDDAPLYLSKRRSINYLGFFLIFMGVLVSGKASAYVLVLSDVSSGYSNCSYTETDTVATFNLTIQFKSIDGRLGGARFNSRGIMLYTYDENGALLNSGSVASTMTLNGVSYTAIYQDALGKYVMYNGRAAASQWTTTTAMTANVTFTVLKSKIAAWPAVGVRAGNFTDKDDVGEITGLAYIGPSSTGNCSVLTNPENPPPAVSPTVTMTAPDWDLGELPRGEETELTLPATKDQLCFNYEGSTAITNQKYLINASNTNGLSANGRYLLKSLEDSSQTVPYTLTLANSTDSVLLPNIQNRLFSLDAGGKTCFTPTFKAEPDKAIKGGAYSDILTFTVVAKP